MSVINKKPLISKVVSNSFYKPYATANNTMTLDSAQTITGVKTFSEIDLKVSADGTTNVGQITQVGNFTKGSDV